MVTADRELRVLYEPRGAIRDLWLCHEPQILVAGPADTGKTYGILQLMHFLAIKYPGMRGLICRKRGVTLTSTTLLTFSEKVLRPEMPVSFFGGNKEEPASYRYQNGSRIVVGGLDEESKVLGAEYDMVFVNQGEETTEGDLDTLSTRCSGRHLPKDQFPFPRLIVDCNPTFSSHHLMKRCESGRMHLIRSTHADNPTITEERLEVLRRLGGTRRQRLYEGIWTGVENAIYATFDRDAHIRDLPTDIHFRDGAIGVDYGHVHAAAAVAVSVDQYGRRWVREAWGEPDDEHGNKVTRHVRRLWDAYSLRKGCVDPLQDVLIGRLGLKAVSLATGARQARINAIERLLDVFPGGHVPAMGEEARGKVPLGPYLEPDSPGLLLVKGAPGIEELAEQMEAYHYIHVINEQKDTLEVARINEDLVAAMEYANQALEMIAAPLPGRAVLDYTAPRVTPTGWRKV